MGLIAEYLAFFVNARLRSIEKFVSENGQSMEISQTAPNKYGKLGECYKNATLYALGHELEYAEGFAITYDLPIPLLHAWCLDKNGMVIDPTWDNGSEYFGVVIPMDIVEKVIYRRRKYGVLDDPEHKFPIVNGKIKLGRKK